MEPFGAGFVENSPRFASQFVCAIRDARSERDMRVMRVEALLSKSAPDAAEVVQIIARRDDRSFPDLSQLRPQFVEAGDAVGEQYGEGVGHGWLRERFAI